MKTLCVRKTTYRLKSAVSLTVAVISDFHDNGYETVVRMLREDPPDVIAVVGDLFLGFKPKRNLPAFEFAKNVLPLLQACVNIAPTVMSIGNHDWLLSEEDIHVLKQMGVEVLHNEWKRYVLKEQQVLFGGLTSAQVAEYWKYREHFYLENGYGDRYPDWDRNQWAKSVIPDSNWLFEFVKREGYKILLSHHPEYWAVKDPFLKEHKIDLVISGHAHGGQIRFFNRGLWASGQGWFPKYVRGLYQGKHGNIVVSTGIANTARITPRLFNPPEIVYVVLGDNK